MGLSKIVFFVFVFLLSFSAYAEVMDKEPSLTLNFVWGIGGSIIILLCARHKPWLLLVSIPIATFYFYALLSEINDAFVGPAILREAGEFYVKSAYIFSALLFCSLFIGFYWRSQQQDHNQSLKKDAKKEGAS